MSTFRQVESPHTPTTGVAHAHYFRSQDKTLFGWLHFPSAERRSPLGLVICNPFGYEATCAHRSVRAIAETAAELGVPALRFDYLGTGDSQDIDSNANQVESWSQNTVDAVSELQRVTGVTSICLIGVRLGAVVAMLAARHCAAVNALGLIAPVIDGRRYVRELRSIRLGAALFSKSPPDSGVASSRLSSDAPYVDISGFPMSAATLAALAALDCATSRSAPAPNTLVIDSQESPVSREWTTALDDTTARIAYRSLPGITQMFKLSPLMAFVPGDMLAEIRSWINALLPDPTESLQAMSGAVAGQDLPLPTTMSLTVLNSDPATPSSISERPAFIASDAMLFGIVTEPTLGERRRRGVILLNTGADYHVGANRMHVTLARRWAQQGYVVLRLDISGIGDSATPSGGVNDDVFPTGAIEDIGAAINFLRNHYAVENMTIAGVCSGAYHALRAAVAGLPIDRILMVNPQNYFWKKGQRIDEIQLAEVVRNPPTYLTRLLSLRTWELLVTGQVNVIRIFKIYLFRSFLAVESTFRELGRRFNFRLPNDLGEELEQVAARGVRMVFVFAKGEAGIGLLRLQAGSSVKRVGDGCRIHIIDGGDHIFSQRKARELMQDVLTEEMAGQDKITAIRADEQRATINKN